MRRCDVILFCFLLVILSCNAPSNEPSQFGEESAKVSNDTLTLSQQASNISPKCMRERAKPILEEDHFPNILFELQADSLSAYEIAFFENGDKLIIHHWGCEEYALTFRFEIREYQQHPENLAYWFDVGGRLMTSMLRRQKAIDIDIKRSLVFLESYVLRDKRNDYKNLKLKEEIEFDGGQTRRFIAIDTIEKMSENKYAIDITLVKELTATSE